MELLNTKLKNLLRAYKSAKDGNKGTGNTLIKAPFEDLMEEIFGNNPIISNNHVLSLSGTETMALTPKKSTDSHSSTPNTVSAEMCNCTALTQTQATLVGSIESAGVKNQCGEVKTKKRKSVKERYYEEKNIIKKDYLQKKLEEIKQRRLDKANQHNEKMEALKNYLQ